MEANILLRRTEIIRILVNKLTLSVNPDINLQRTGVSILANLASVGAAEDITDAGGIAVAQQALNSR